MFRDKLIQKQPVVFQTLHNAFAHHKLAHAYVFVGQKGTPKKETALFLAQSLICQKKDGMACEECEDCQRVVSGNYADLIYIDGTNTSIKKEDILHLQQEFNKTGLEKFNQKIYILDKAENATVEALNSLLKFLEEPGGESTTAFLLVEQMDRVLPTILSRCQIIQFKSLTMEYCYNQCKSLGMDELDAYILSNLIRDLDQIQNTVEDNAYQCALTLAKTFIEQFLQNPNVALTFLHLDGFKGKDKENDKSMLKYFLDILILFYKDSFKQRQCESIWWNQNLDLISKSQYDIQKIVFILLEGQDKVNRTINVPLLLDQLVYQMKEAK